jgi:glutamate racemase
MPIKMDPNAPIGIFDSGLGGLAVLREVNRLLPNEDCLFLGDTLRQPYGPRTIEVVRQYAIEITGYLIEKGAKMVLIGCNTASIAGGDAAQACFPDVPVIGMIRPGVRAALRASRSKRIGVWGTEITVASQAYDQSIVNIDPQAAVVGVACPTLLRLAEKGKIGDRPYLRDLATKDFQNVASFGADTLILGCTDFTCVRDIIDEVVGNQVVVVDPAEEVVREASRVMAERGGANPGLHAPARMRFLITGDDQDNFSSFGAKFLGVPVIDVTRVPLADVQAAASLAR